MCIRCLKGFSENQESFVDYIPYAACIIPFWPLAMSMSVNLLHSLKSLKRTNSGSVIMELL